MEFQVRLITYLQSAYLSLLSLQQSHIVKANALTGADRSIYDAFEQQKQVFEQRVRYHRSQTLERVQNQLSVV